MNDNKTIVTKLIFVDCLEISFIGRLPDVTSTLNANNFGLNNRINVTSNCYLELQKGGNKNFCHIANLIIDNQQIGEFRFMPRAKYINGELISFKFDNAILYQMRFPEYIEFIIQTLKLKFRYIAHIDIAIDCVDSDLMKFVNNYLFRSSNMKNYSVRHKGKVSRRNIRTDIHSIIHWGNLHSEKYIKIYNKTAELATSKVDKSYINECWLRNGMNCDNKIVERFELTLKQKHASMLDYCHLMKSDYLASVMKTHCKNFFDFEQTFINHSKKNKRDITPINFNGFKTTLLTKYQYKSHNTLHTVKIMFKQLYFVYLQAKFIAVHPEVISNHVSVPDGLKNYQNIYDSINSLRLKYPTLDNYFCTKKDIWEKEFNRVDELSTGKLSISDYVRAIGLAIELNSPNELNVQESFNGDEAFIYRVDVRLIELEKKLNQLNLKQLSQDSKTVARIAKPILVSKKIVVK